MARFNVRLTKVSDNPNDLRTKVVEGHTNDLSIEVGKPFIMFAQPLDPMASFRLVATSIIQNIEVETDRIGFAKDLYPIVYTVKTLNSTYKIEVLGKKED